MTAPVVFLDIETLPAYDSPEWRAHAETLPAVAAATDRVTRASAALVALIDAGPKRPAANLTDPAKIAAALEKRTQEHAADLVAAREALTDAVDAVAPAMEAALRATSLDPLWGRVCCVGLAVDDGEPMVLAADTEAGTLLAVQVWLAEVASQRRGPIVYVMHNGRGFDVPFLRVRSIVHNLPALARAFGAWRGKPWESPLVDTMELWPSTGRGAFTRLQAIRRALGLPVQVGIDGSQVAAAWHDGRRDEVIRHCREDVAGLREVYYRIRDVL